MFSLTFRRLLSFRCIKITLLKRIPPQPRASVQRQEVEEDIQDYLELLRLLRHLSARSRLKILLFFFNLIPTLNKLRERDRRQYFKIPGV